MNRRATQLFLTMTVLAISASGYAQLPFKEDFSTTVYLDDGPGQTTADWNTGFQQLLLPISPRLDGVTFDETSAVEIIDGTYVTRAIDLADLNGDGNLDLIDGVRGRSGVQLNIGGGVFGSRSYTSPVFRNTRGIATGDVDRDGDIDFVAANFGFSIDLYLNDGTGTFFAVQNVSADAAKTDDVALADIDGDGFLDIIAANLGFERNKIFINTADPLTPFGVGGLDGIDSGFNRESSKSIAVGDLDKDGDLDFVFMNEDAPNPSDNNRQQRNRVFMNRLAQGFPMQFVRSEIEIVGSNDIGRSVDGALGDLDGDGYLDLVVCNRADGQASVVYLNNGVGATNVNPFTVAAVDFSSGTSPGNPIPCNSTSLADVDNDGDLDILLTSSSVDFRNRIYFNDGSGMTFSQVDVGPVGQAPLVLGNLSDTGAFSFAGAVGDVDNDGDIDWIIGNQLSDSISQQNNLFRNSGSSGTSVVRQLRAKATSLQIDSSGANSVKLTPSPSSSMVGPEFLNRINYWVSGNAGQTWASITPDGRPVAIGSGADIRWRADLRSESPAMAAGLALFQLDIAENESGPVLVTPIGSAEVHEDDGTTGLPIVSSFADPDGDAIYHSVTGLPVGTGLSIDPLTGEITGVPTNEDSNGSPYVLTVTATDGALTATDTFTLTVIGENDAPFFVSTPPAGNATQDTFYSYAIIANDIDRGDTELLAFSIATAPAWLTITDNANGSATLSGIPDNSDVIGDNSVTIVVSDPGGLSDTQSFSITVDNVNDQPVFVTDPPAAGAMQGAPYTYNIITSDPDDSETIQVTISAAIKPVWLTLVDNGDGTAVLAGIPTVSDVAGDNSVVLEVTDPGGLSSAQSFVVSVRNTNVAPEFAGTPITSATELSEYRYSIRVIDPNADSVSITAPTLPDWLTLVDRGGGFAILRGTPSGSDVGNHGVVIQATEDAPAQGLVASQQFVITVTASSNGPTITVNGDANMTVFQDWNFSDPGATAADLEDGDLTDQVDSEGVVTTNAPGVYTITYTVSDSAGNRAQVQRIVRVVSPPEQGGIGSGGPAWLLTLFLFACFSRFMRRAGIITKSNAPRV